MLANEKRPLAGGRVRVLTTTNTNTYLSTERDVLDAAGWVLAFERDGREDPDLRRLLPAARTHFRRTLRLAGAA